MITAPRLLASLVPLVLLLAAAGCDGTNEPTTGALRLTVVTTGGDLDLNGYLAALDGAAPQPIPANGSAAFADLPTGSHEVALTDVAANCTLNGANPRTASVVGGDTTDVTFAIACVATGVRITTTSTGTDLDPDGYAVSVDGVLAAVVGVNGNVEITRLAIGGHTVALTAVAANCPVTGDTARSVSLVLGEVEAVAFDLTCGAVTGVIEVTTATSGVDLDPNGYTIQVDGGSPQPLTINGTATFPTLSGGDHSVTLAGAAGNCTPSGQNPRTVHVTTGGLTRDTARTTFQVSCGAVTGVIEVTTATSGVDIDGNGYQVSLDGGTPLAAGVNGVVRFNAVSAGDHSVSLGDAAPNCPVSAENPRVVSVTTGGLTRDTARTTFQVSCGAVTGIIEVTAATSGVELDADGYGVRIDGGAPRSVAMNGTATFEGISGGDHSVALDSVAGNCTIGGENPRTVPVTVGGTTRDTARTTFAVTCVATTGTLKVTAATSGAELDPNGYDVGVDEYCYNYYGYEYCYYLSTSHVGANGSVTLPGLPVGDHTVKLNDVAANCTVAGDNPGTASVLPGDTVELAFAITCVARGAMRVAVTTTGVDLDPNGYTLVASGPSSVNSAVAVNGTFLFPGLLPGAYQVSLAGVAGNCAVVGANPSVTVPPGDTAQVAFTVSCVALGSLEVAATTTGADLDPDGYTLTVAGTNFNTSRSLGINETAALGGLVAGDYQATLSGVAPNCTVAAPNPRAVAVTSGATATVTFAVTCAALARVRVTNATTGVDLDPNGYTVVLSGPSFSSSSLSVNGTVLLGPLAPGDYQVTLRDVTLNCDVAGANPRPVTVAPGDTTALAFDIACATARELAVAVQANGNTDVYRVKANGTGLTRLTTPSSYDAEPAWSHDGSTIAFVSDRDANPEIYTMDPAGLGQVRRTNSSGADSRPTWSPDGSKLAFVSGRDGNPEIYVMNADGTNPVRLTNHVAVDQDPAWSPDGNTIAFSSNRDGNFEIYTMNANGSGTPTRLTTNSVDDVQPDWSPNGGRLVFSRFAACYYGYYGYYGYCDNDLYFMDANGSNVVQLTSAPGSVDVDPAWSPDGLWIAFGATFCEVYAGCYAVAVYAASVDGSRVVEVTRDVGAFHPAWRRP